MEFLAELKLARTARVGVILCRTKEPNRLADMLQKYAIGGEKTRKPFYVWDVRQGWRKLDYGKTPSAIAKLEKLPPQMDEEEELTPAPTSFGPCLAMLPKFDKDAICVMINGHDHLGSAVIKQTLSDFSTEFQNGDGLTLIISMGEGSKIPPEIESDIQVLDLPLPGPKELGELVSEKFLERRQLTGDETAALVHAGRGMTYAEASRAYARAIASYLPLMGTVAVSLLVGEVVQAKTNIIQKSEVLQLYPTCSMDDIGGLRGLKGWLEFNRVRLDPKHINRGADPLRGIILVGGPGTGKSLSAKAIAASFSLPLIRLDLAACFGGIVGESEAKMEAAMNTLKALGACVVWIDEIDKAGLSPGANGDSGASSRMLQKLLFEMQEMKEGIFWVLTANRVAEIPSEMLRPGRLDEKWFVDLPNESDRLDILGIHLRKRNLTVNRPINLTNFASFIEASKGFIGAEVEKAIVDSDTYCCNHDCPLTESILAMHAAAINPTSNAFKRDFDAMVEWGAQHARNASIPFNSAPAPTHAIIARPAIVAPPVVPAAKPAVRRPALKLPTT